MTIQASPETCRDEQTLDAPPTCDLTKSKSHLIKGGGVSSPLYRPELRLQEVGSLGEGDAAASA